MAAIPAAMDSAAFRLGRRSARQYSDFTGTTNATLNTQTLYNHGLTDDVGRPLVPSRVEAIGNVAAAAAVYEVSANHTATQVDIRSAGTSVSFRARAWA